MPSGGGYSCGPRRCSKKLKLDDDEQIGVTIIARAIEALCAGLQRTRATRAQSSWQKVLEMGPEEGFNAQTEKFENLVQAGVIDPTKLVRSALQHAAPIASLLLTNGSGHHADSGKDWGRCDAGRRHGRRNVLRSSVMKQARRPSNALGGRWP